ncbi:glycoside hydrolase family 65 protein [Actinophytocola algeriensis]|uniref:Alpha,alpha-trehalose phosphorylase n=1 Tax=Actinophytocola algeriensis TaxID=1768010 RepID=A0A7W7QB19_9PSEU|nr:glycoside hydrolase family 65 protein [Actinophytocola algeriensis]MBB4910148.1 alpha,alpha-trehalose phosphorylase [Actinophytocola algeriensis]MBE1480864.1 alpha,alpha-trehalose phosphorylase [Actinophytocola algeriensis]
MTSGFQVDPWQLQWNTLDLSALDRTESVFALSNGHIGMRGTLEEGEPTGLAGTYLNGFYEQHALPYAEAGYGYPEDGQTVVNVTDGKIIRLLVQDEPLDMRYGRALDHHRVLDFRTGTLRRDTVWESPTGRRVRVRTERLVSFTQRAVAAIHYEVEPLDGDVQLVVQSDLLANEPIESASRDPRVAATLNAPLVAEDAFAEEYHAVLVHQTRKSGLRVAAAMDHELDTDDGLRCEIQAEDDLARLTAAVDVPKDSRLRVTKYVAYGWSARRSAPALRAQVDAALSGALQTGWKGLLAEQRRFLDDFWATADVEIEGDAELQQAVRFALFHVLQAGARGESRAIPAKGLTGPGYDGHSFWDSETFVLPVLTYTVPEAARDALRWRHSTLDKARERADALGLKGAAFPWRSINGAECSAYWPAGTAAFHVSADVADGVVRYLAATDDTDFERDHGAEILVETARLWCSIGHHDVHGGFRIDGVTGPDEYSAVVDNNVYTNLMAQRNLREAVAVCERQPEVAERLGVTAEQVHAWQEAADKMVVPYDEMLGVHPQSERFTEHARWDFANTPEEHYPLLLHYPYFDLYRKQVVKQADLVMAMYSRGDHFTSEQKVRNVDYYEPITVRDSSLSACVQAVMAAEVGYLELAYDYFAEAALTDLHDLHANVRNGLHIASLAGAWTVAVAGFGGMRDHDRSLAFAPRLPEALTRLAFRLTYRESRFAVEIDQDSASYTLLEGPSLTVRHHGEGVPLVLGTVERRPIPALPAREAPSQPRGRAPHRRTPKVF